MADKLARVEVMDMAIVLQLLVVRMDTAEWQPIVQLVVVDFSLMVKTTPNGLPLLPVEVHFQMDP